MKALLKEAMDHVKRKGAEYADARKVRGLNEILVMRNGELETASITESEGFGIRVLLNGAWGFSSSSAMTPDKVTEVAERLVGFDPKRARQLVKDTERADLAPLIPKMPF